MSKWTNNIKLAAGWIALIVLVAYLAGVIINQRDMGIDVAPNADGRMAVTAIEPDSWAKGIIKPGDIVVNVDGADPPIGSDPDVWSHCRRRSHRDRTSSPGRFFVYDDAAR
ncbi:hypothetical protein VQ056_28725 [Paenibacillus sp. JTLBN-2024]